MSGSPYEGLLNSKVARYTRTTTTNEFGEQIETWAYSASGIKCRLVPISLEEHIGLPGKYDNAKYTGYFLSSQTLTSDDEIHYDGDTYHIIEVSDDSSNYVRKAILSYKP